MGEQGVTRGVPMGEARARLAELVDRTRRTREPVHLTRNGAPVAVLVDAGEWALLAELAGDRQAALQALNAAVASGYRDAAYLQVSPLFSALRTDPGFAAVLQSVQAHVATERARVIASGILPEDARQATAAR